MTKRFFFFFFCPVGEDHRKTKYLKVKTIELSHVTTDETQLRQCLKGNFTGNKKD